MYSQLFKNKIPEEIIHQLIDTNFVKEGDIYVFNKYVFKKMTYEEKVKNFCECIEPYYHNSKKKYVKKEEHTYKSLATVIRQLCKYHEIDMKSKIKYSNSTYETMYYINLNNNEKNEPN